MQNNKKIKSVKIVTDESTSATQFYLDVKNKKMEVKYIHDDLIPFVENTNGIIAYQEQIMAILVQICGYSLEESDQIRGAIAKKKEHVMLATFDRIRSATKERGWTEDQSETLCQTILAFSRYSFNLSHSHAYAELGYITMFLKHHHKLEWWASVLNNEKSEDKTRSHIRLLGDLVKSPSMKNPTKKFDIVDAAIVAPIGSIKGVGPAVVTELTTKGPFEDLKDYVERVAHNKVNIGAVSNLIKGRAADPFMDQDLSYPRARLKFMDDYMELRGKRATKFKDEMRDVDPLSIFLMEREKYKCFNKHLLMDNDMLDVIDQAWPSLHRTGRAGIPFVFGQSQVPVLCNIHLAESLYKRWDEQKEVCLILLFVSSTVRKGVSKKSGNPWSLLSTTLSDGYNTIEITQWGIEKPLKHKKNSIVFVRGKLKEGWKQPVAMDAMEISPIDIDNIMCEKILLGGFDD